MGSSSCLAIREQTFLTGAQLSLSLSLYLPDVIMNWTCLCLILSLTALVSEALVLLDPNTGRPREVATPQRKQSVFRMGFVSNLENNKVESSPIRRSDYISPSGVPLYKLRKRNPYGFGGKK